MEYGKESIKKEIRELINQGHIIPEDIPSIELYMDQVTTFMDRYLSGYKRNDEDKTLTKTMINNYTKNNLLPPPEKKRYGKEHIILLIYIYYLKNVVSISDIQVLLEPLIRNYYDKTDDKYNLEAIYESTYKMEQHQYFDTENSIIKSLELAKKNFPDGEDDYLQELSFLSLLGYDIFMKKKLMEKIIDDMAARKDEKELSKKEAAKKDKQSKKNKDA